jgi:Arc/MetJ family transcription regulator
MTKRLIDVDDAKLAVVRELLGTDTLKATVDEAFDEVIALEVRRRQLLEQALDTLAEFIDPGSREAAWR